MPYRGSIRLWLCLCLLVSVGLFGPASSIVGALQAEPTPQGRIGGKEPLPTDSSPPGIAITAVPAEVIRCDTNPVPMEVLIAAAAATPQPTPDRWQTAAPVPAELIDVATGVIEQLVACANDTDSARLYALFTSEGIARSLKRQGVTPDAVPFMLRENVDPLPPALQAVLLSVGAVLRSDDNRLLVEFALSERDGVGERRIQAYLVELARVDENWLIEDISRM